MNESGSANRVSVPFGARVARAPWVATMNRSGPLNSMAVSPAPPSTGMATELPPPIGTLRGELLVARYAIDWPSGEKLIVNPSSVPSSRRGRRSSSRRV